MRALPRATGHRLRAQQAELREALGLRVPLTRRGEGVATYFGHFGAALQDPHIEVQELTAEGDRVIALGVEHARVRTSGKPFAARFAHVWTIRDGQVLRMEGIIDTATIRAAFTA